MESFIVQSSVRQLWLQKVLLINCFFSDKKYSQLCPQTAGVFRSWQILPWLRTRESNVVNIDQHEHFEAEGLRVSLAICESNTKYELHTPTQFTEKCLETVSRK